MKFIYIALLAQLAVAKDEENNFLKPKSGYKRRKLGYTCTPAVHWMA